jgi:organic radical activating enzyme
MSKDTYCSQPYYNIHIEGEEKSPCCLIYNPDYFTKQPVTEAFRSKAFDNIRDAFDRGEQHPACQTCWRQESVGTASPRRAYTQRQHNATGIGQRPTQPLSVQWNFSNTCNFACRTCHLQYSTGWLRETRMLKEQGDAEATQQYAQWSKSPWDQTRLNEIVPHLDTIQHLELFGGETLLAAKMPELLQMIIAQGRAQHIALVLTTNGSVAPRPQLVELLSQFRSVKMTFSIDAVTPNTFRYIRTGDWHQVSENIDRWREQPVNTFANPTFSSLNVWDCDRILKTLGQRFGITNVGWNWVEGPARYNAVHLPDAVKQHITDHSRYFHSRKLLPQLYSSQRSETQWQDFLQRTQWLDESRNQPMKKYMPELYDMIYTAT